MRTLPRSHRRAPRAGFTLLEQVLTATLLSIVMAGVAMVGLTSQSLYEQSSRAEQLEMQAVRGLDRAVRELDMLIGGLMLPDPATQFGTEDLAYQIAVGVAAGAAAPGPPMRLLLEYEPGEVNDGLDNDGDGVVDEGQLVLVRNDGIAGEQRTVICRGVRELLEGETLNGADDNGNGVRDERGFNVHRVGELMNVRLSLEEADREGQLIVRTVETTFRLRN